LRIWKTISRQVGIAISALRQNRAAAAALAVILLYLGVTIFADVVVLRDPSKTTSATLRPPSREFPFGTDDLGRDVFSGVIHGARASLVIGLSVAMISGLIGSGVGMLSGYAANSAGGWVDDLLMRVTEFFLAPPRFFLALVIAAIFGSSFTNLILILSLTYWPTTARLIRAETMSLGERDFILAARASGASHARILRRNILPHLAPLIIVGGVVRTGNVIMVEAGLEFLGLGDQSQITWGYLLHNGQHFMRDAWWMVVFPILAVSALLVAINVLADELNRLLDPRQPTLSA
jgi:peptide/nickel transport system permease protein